MAERQENAISRDQLIACGLTRHQIDAAIGRWLHPHYRAVYSVGTPRLTPGGRAHAVLLALGAEAAISHLWAAALHGFHKYFAGLPQVTTPKPKDPRDGMRIYRRALPLGDAVLLDGVRVTTTARTIFDIAADHGREAAERAINEAQFLKKFDPMTMPSLIAAHRGWKGASTMRAIWEHGDFAITREELERRFRVFLKRYRLPLPETNVWMLLAERWIEADCVWREQRLIVELDGGQAHKTDKRFHGDRWRDRKLDIEGWRVWRITWQHLRDEPDELAADLRRRLGV